MIGLVEGAVFIVLLRKIVKNDFSSLGIKPVEPVVSPGVIRNHLRQSTSKLNRLEQEIDSYA